MCMSSLVCSLSWDNNFPLIFVPVMIHRHLASEVDMILTDKSSLIDSYSGAFAEFNSQLNFQNFLQP